MRSLSVVCHKSDSLREQAGPQPRDSGPDAVQPTPRGQRGKESRWGVGGVFHDARGPAPAVPGVDVREKLHTLIPPAVLTTRCSAFLSNAEQLQQCVTVMGYVKTLSTPRL